MMICVYVFVKMEAATSFCTLWAGFSFFQATRLLLNSGSHLWAFLCIYSFVEVVTVVQIDAASGCIGDDGMVTADRGLMEPSLMRDFDTGPRQTVLSKVNYCIVIGEKTINLLSLSKCGLARGYTTETQFVN